MDGASITSDPKESPVSIDTETHTHISHEYSRRYNWVFQWPR